MRGLAAYVLHQRDRYLVWEGHIEFAGDEGEDRSRAVGDDGVFDTVEIGAPRLPVIRVARHLDRLVGFVLDEFERPGADRMRAHLARRNVAWINRRIAGGEQRDQGRLALLEVEGHFAVAVGGDLVDIGKPGFAVVEAQLLRRFTGQQIVRAFDVRGRKGLSIMPFDALAEVKAQFGRVLAPRPARREIGHDRLHAVLTHVLVE